MAAVGEQRGDGRRGELDWTFRPGRNRTVRAASRRGRPRSLGASSARSSWDPRASARFACQRRAVPGAVSASERACVAGFLSMAVKTLRRPSRGRRDTPRQERGGRCGRTGALAGRERPRTHDRRTAAPARFLVPLDPRSSAGCSERATASIPRFMSSPATRPLSPTRSAATRATAPVPHATSSPGRRGSPDSVDEIDRPRQLTAERDSARTARPSALSCTLGSRSRRSQAHSAESRSG